MSVPDAPPTSGSRPFGVLATRPALIAEILLVGIGYTIYTMIRNAAPTRVVAAFDHAASIHSLEQHLGIAHEVDVNSWLYGIPWLSTIAGYWYAIMHFVVTIGVLVYLWYRHPVKYRVGRTVLYATTALALVGFWAYPLAPPRMLGWLGFVDTIQANRIWGSWGNSGMDAVSNQYAAMPSMHIGWSTWCAIMICWVATRRWVKVLAVLYPLITLAVIVGTANHFVLDAVGGWLCLAAGFAVTALILPPWNRMRTQHAGRRAARSPLSSQSS